MSTRIHVKQLASVAAGAALAAAMATQSASARVDFGNEGDAVNLVIGYQPYYTDGREAVQRMSGKVTTAPHGACTDRFARLAFQKTGIEPKRYLNQNIEVIATNFRAGKLDATVIREPTASEVVLGDIARRAASGEDFEALDGRLIEISRVHSSCPCSGCGGCYCCVASTGVVQTDQIDKNELKHSLFGGWPAEQGGGEVKVQLDFIVTERVQGLLDDATAYSLPKKPVAAATIHDGGVMDSMAHSLSSSSLFGERGANTRSMMW